MNHHIDVYCMSMLPKIKLYLELNFLQFSMQNFILIYLITKACFIQYVNVK
jgi:hypothetical protein